MQIEPDSKQTARGAAGLAPGALIRTRPSCDVALVVSYDTDH